MVYSLDRDRYGVIVAESVIAGYTKALGKTIIDPCFEVRYIAQYRNGRVKAIDDVSQATMTTCYLEQLEQLEVKANLVVPVINEKEQLFGLLVAHQCSAPRHWETSEIEFLRQLGNKAGLLLENASLSDKITQLQTQAAQERQWTNHFTNTVQYIRQSLKQDNVLEISVEEVRRVLNCDRVLVYSLKEDKYGVVVAESVAAGYPKALNKTIEDPCFAARYLDKYRDGRVRALDNIHEAGMTACYIEQLETLKVKANLVTPILNEGKLFGLLVAHQCSAPRHWQDYEIRWLTQIATQVGFALDNASMVSKQQSDGIAPQQWINFNMGLIDATTKLELFKVVVEEARKIIATDRVVVYQFDKHWKGTIVAESVIPGYPRIVNSPIADSCFAEKYAEQYRQGRTKAIANIHYENLTDCHLQQLEEMGVKASLIVPILVNKELFGLLIAHQFAKPRMWKQSESDLFAQLALQLGLALDKLELRQALSQTQNKQPSEEGQQVSELISQTQATLQKLQAKIQHQATAIADNL